MSAIEQNNTVVLTPAQITEAHRTDLPEIPPAQEMLVENPPMTDIKRIIDDREKKLAEILAKVEQERQQHLKTRGQLPESEQQANNTLQPENTIPNPEKVLTKLTQAVNPHEDIDNQPVAMDSTTTSEPAIVQSTPEAPKEEKVTDTTSEVKVSSSENPTQEVVQQIQISQQVPEQTVVASPTPAMHEVSSTQNASETSFASQTIQHPMEEKLEQPKVSPVEQKPLEVKPSEQPTTPDKPKEVPAQQFSLGNEKKQEEKKKGGFFGRLFGTKKEKVFTPVEKMPGSGLFPTATRPLVTEAPISKVDSPSIMPAESIAPGIPVEKSHDFGFDTKQEVVAPQEPPVTVGISEPIQDKPVEIINPVPEEPQPTKQEPTLSIAKSEAAKYKRFMAVR